MLQYFSKVVYLKTFFVKNMINIVD